MILLPTHTATSIPALLSGHLKVYKMLLLRSQLYEAKEKSLPSRKECIALFSKEKRRLGPHAAHSGQAARVLLLSEA